MTTYRLKSPPGCVVDEFETVDLGRKVLVFPVGAARLLTQEEFNAEFEENPDVP